MEGKKIYCKFFIVKKRNIQSLTENSAFPSPAPAPKAASLLWGSPKIHLPVLSWGCKLLQVLFSLQVSGPGGASRPAHDFLCTLSLQELGQEMLCWAVGSEGRCPCAGIWESLPGLASQGLPFQLHPCSVPVTHCPSAKADLLDTWASASQNLLVTRGCFPQHLKEKCSDFYWNSGFFFPANNGVILVLIFFLSSALKNPSLRPDPW